MVGQRYDFLRALCAIGKVISAVALLGGVLLLLGGRGYGVGAGDSLRLMASAAGSYIGFEVVVVLVAVEANTRAAAHLLNRLVDRPAEPDGPTEPGEPE